MAEQFTKEAIQNFAVNIITGGT
ncbi:uncharacterized protein G2W53_018591 [Senna tora]|uniref:Uncharacterized protein n=1 Tax=Senna tora TaxID=362788 RepID=A0A834TU02_9FABA|nr:uncharacterized protein G2W53_018591 [Senna tora]